MSKENVVPDVVQAAAKRVLETNKAMADGARRKALQDASAAAGPPAALTVMSDAALQDAITEKQNAVSRISVLWKSDFHEVQLHS